MKKTTKLLCAVLALAALLAVPSGARYSGYIQVTGYDPAVDYTAKIDAALADGSVFALEMGAIYEQQRNMKIEDMGLDYELEYYFQQYSTVEEIRSARDKPKRLSRMKKEYPVAGAIYEVLNAKGFSDPVIAGILGNMMTECGRDTLDLQWSVYDDSGSFYGLCQWSLYYNPWLGGYSVAGQLDHLLASIGPTFGSRYEEFLALTDAGEAARWFSDYYERPACWETVRATNAEAALEWIRK